MSESFLNGKVTLHRGDCLEILPTLEADSIDSCVTDPPYHLSVIKTGSLFPGRREGQKHKSGGRGFMGKEWDGGDVAFRPELWAEVLRVLKPGAHLLAFSGTRTYHRMACAIEDAGFEIRDQIGWCYGSGFPKSHAIDRAIEGMLRNGKSRYSGNDELSTEDGISIPGDQLVEMSHRTTDKGFTGKRVKPELSEAIQWQGWGTALKPAWEPIVLARKPLSESSIAANVLKHGTGGINIDGCRIATADGHTENGRWPANLIHDGSEEVVRGFPEADGCQPHTINSANEKYDGWGSITNKSGETVGYSGKGSAARFFYTAKADSDDRLGSKHPTVKPVDLIQYLVRLITPAGGIVLDPFAGTGTCGEAAFREGIGAILIEREEEYQADIVRRMGLCLAGPDERARETIKAAGKVDDAGPLFGGVV